MEASLASYVFQHAGMARRERIGKDRKDAVNKVAVAYPVMKRSGFGERSVSERKELFIGC